MSEPIIYKAFRNCTKMLLKFIKIPRFYFTYFFPLFEGKYMYFRIVSLSWKRFLTHCFFPNVKKVLTHLTLLIHTSVLPSNWNLCKIFAPIRQLGQVHMVKKIFPIFLHAWRWLFLLLNLWFSSKLVSKMNYKKMASAWRNFKNNSFTICTWPNGPVRAKILQRFQFEGKTNVWISQVRRVKSFQQKTIVICSKAGTKNKTYWV